ncbi:MAG: hypothetical protein MJ241_02255 [Bacilli bacterium]|nr:hypothetical protein [Bacilli bacterium]
MIDLTNMPQKKKSYGGANGSKISVVYNGEVYMVKLPVHSTAIIQIKVYLIAYNLIALIRDYMV